MIKVWANDFLQMIGTEHPDYQDLEAVQEAYDEALNRLAALEDIGFEGVFLAEHHFIAALDPNPNLIIAALARMTKKLRLGVMGNVLAFHQPWKLAEDLAMLDYITSGRLELGFASGLGPEFNLVNIPAEEIRPRYNEILDFLEIASAETVVSHHGEFYDYDDMPLMPRPLNDSRRRKWMAIYSPQSAAAAARRGYKICTAFQSADSAAKVFQTYRDTADEAGIAVSSDDIGLRRTIMIWDTDREADEMHEVLIDRDVARLRFNFATVEDRFQRDNTELDPHSTATGIRDFETRGSANENESSVNVAAKLAGPEIRELVDEFIHGSPQTVADQIIDQCERTGAGNILAVHQSTASLEQVSHNYELWEQVVPILAKAKVSV